MNTSLMARQDNLPATHFYRTFLKNWLENSTPKIDQPIELHDFFVPLIDVYETDATIVIEAEIPGMNPDTCSVTVQGDLLHIRGQKSSFSKEGAPKYLRVERRQGNFARELRLPCEMEPDTIHIHYRDGILTIHCRKIMP